MGADAEPEELPELDLLRALLADTVDLAAVLELDGKLRYLNRAGRRLLALHRDAPTTTVNVFDLVTATDQPLLERTVLPALEGDGWWTGTLGIVSCAGAEIPTRSTLRRQASAAGPPRLTWIARDISTEKAVYERLHKKIFEDELTGLPHRSMFLDRLDLALRRTQGDPGPVALLFVSLDRFKEKNDRFGREVGDQLLRAVAQRLDALRGPGDTVSRWGGDEFVVMCEAEAGEAAVEPMAMAQRILEALDAPFTTGTIELFQTASIGVASAVAGEMGTDQLLRQADAAGQMAKQRGGGTAHRFDEEMQARALRRAEIEDALRGAADRGELVMHYQPEVSLETNEIVAVESLLRWHHPAWGLVAPAEFVPIAETSNLILEIGAYVLEAAMTQCARWRASLANPPVVAINISARQFLQDDFVGIVASTLERTGADPMDVCLEITEGILMDDVDLTVATLRRLKALGLQLAVDDFGTGYSSLSYLRRFPVDILKVDQSFVSGLGYDPEDSAIVQAVVHMGAALNLTTVAEGVETAHHLIELRELKCDIAQGYHFARPGPADAITRLLQAGPDWQRVTV
jgi:diguanylate cyclase (GGDEF)-like protein